MPFKPQECARAFAGDEKNSLQIKNSVQRFVNIRFQGKYEKAFKHYDNAKGSAGKLTKKELESLFKDACQSYHSKIAEGIILEFDTNGDRAINYRELEQILKRK